MVVFEIAAALFPPVFGMRMREDIGTQRLRIESAILSKVDNIDFDFLVDICANGEIVPLNMSSRIGIDPHEEIVFSRAYFNDCVQISTFEVAVESWLLKWG